MIQKAELIFDALDEFGGEPLEDPRSDPIGLHPHFVKVVELCY